MIFRKTLIAAGLAALLTGAAQAQEAASPVAEGEYRGGRIDPFSGATALSSCLERTSMYHQFIQQSGSTRDALVETTATFLQSMLTPRC